MQNDNTSPLDAFKRMFQSTRTGLRYLAIGAVVIVVLIMSLFMDGTLTRVPEPYPTDQAFLSTALIPGQDLPEGWSVVADSSEMDLRQLMAEVEGMVLDGPCNAPGLHNVFPEAFEQGVGRTYTMDIATAPTVNVFVWPFEHAIGSEYMLHWIESNWDCTEYVSRQHGDDIEIRLVPTGMRQFGNEEFKRRISTVLIDSDGHEHTIAVQDLTYVVDRNLVVYASSHIDLPPVLEVTADDEDMVMIFTDFFIGQSLERIRSKQ